jgi:DNA-binding NarL/FixJ family response regulator
MLAEGVTMLLVRTEDLRLISYCSKAEDLSHQIDLHQPDILLVDLNTEFPLALLTDRLNLPAQTKIILWTNSISTELALQAMSLGVRGILRKTVPVETHLRCLLCVSRGELWFEKALTDSILAAKRYSLTRREGQLVLLLTQGLKNKEIAAALRIAEGTVKVYLSHLFKKLDVKDRFELALYGLKNLAAGGRGTDITAPVPGSNSTASLVHPPRSFFVERVPVTVAL